MTDEWLTVSVTHAVVRRADAFADGEVSKVSRAPEPGKIHLASIGINPAVVSRRPKLM